MFKRGYAVCLQIKLSLVVTFLTLTSSVLGKEIETLEIGAPAPSFHLPGVDGKEYSLEDFKDARLLLVVFTCNHCPTAQAYEQRLIDLHADYSDRGVAVVAISPNSDAAVRLDELGYTDLGDSLEDMKRRAADRGFKFPYLYDGETQETSTKYGVRATPHVYLFDEQRRLQYVGRIDDNDIKEPTKQDARNAIEDLLAGRPVATPTTRVFGCSTKWADKIPAAKAALAKWDKESAELQVVTPDQLTPFIKEPSDNYRLVNVWATWCSPCIEELDDLVTMHRMYRKRHFELITVSADQVDAREDALKVLNEKHSSAKNYLLDADSRDDLFDVVDAQWQGALPYTVLIDPSGKVVHRVHGELEPEELRRVIADHLGRTYASRK